MVPSKNSDYWKIRFGQLEAAQNQKGAETYQKIEKIYKQAQKEIEGKINTWYQRFATNNGVSMAEARKMLSGADLKEFKWDVKDYIKHGQDNTMAGAWMKQLENASAKFHISRLEALKIHTRHSLEIMYEKYLGITKGTMKDVLQSGYYHTAYELQKGFGIGWDIAGLDQTHIEKLLSKPWAVDGKNFSERIWGSKQKLISEIHSELTRNVILGQDPQKAIDAIAKKMNTSKNNAGRLVMTEEAYFSSAAQKDCFHDLDVEKYEIVATLDSHTSEICRNLDGKVFSMKDFEPGVTAPPFHVWCRSTTVPHFDENFGQVGERAARNVDGKTYYVPANMTYEEWKETFVENEADSKRIISKMKNTSDVLTRSKPPIKLQDLESKYKDFIMQVINSASLPFQRVILENQDRIVFAKINAVGKAKYSPENGIFINLKKDFANSRGQWTTLFHEVGHNIDKIYGRPSEQKTFTNVLKNDFSLFTNGYAKNYNISIEKAYEELSKCLKLATNEESHILSDLFEALSGGKCKGNWKHPSDYWRSDKKIGSEAFAHFFSASVTGNNTKLESIQAIFPNAYEEFLKMVGDMK